MLKPSPKGQVRQTDSSVPPSIRCAVVWRPSGASGELEHKRERDTRGALENGEGPGGRGRLSSPEYCRHTGPDWDSGRPLAAARTCPKDPALSWLITPRRSRDPVFQENGLHLLYALGAPCPAQYSSVKVSSGWYRCLQREVGENRLNRPVRLIVLVFSFPKT